MLAKLRRRLRPPTAYEGFAIALAFLALGSGSYAAITGTGKNVKNSSLSGRDIKNNSVTGKDVKGIKSADVTDRSLLAKDFKAGQLPTGPQGPKGDKGDKGDSATRLFAAVQAQEGILIYGSGATESVRTGEGQYTVTFNRDLDNCVALGQVGIGRPGTPPSKPNGTNAGDGIHAFVSDDGEVDVTTWQAGTQTARNDAFMLGVFC
jgi:hypothetical protein